MFSIIKYFIVCFDYFVFYIEYPKSKHGWGTQKDYFILYSLYTII